MRKQIRNPRATCKTPAFCTFQRPFPLTPALFRREREHHWQCIRQPESLGLGAKPALVHPLPEGPEGEGRGEGKRDVRTAWIRLREGDAISDSDCALGHCFGFRHWPSIIRLCLAA